MPGIRWVLLSFLASATGMAAQQPGQPLLDSVGLAMGGVDRILAVRTLLLEGTGNEFRLGQNATPEAELPRYAVTAYRRATDFANRRWALDLTRVPRFVTGNLAAQRQRTAYDAVAFDLLPDTTARGTTARRSTARADADRADELLYHPIGFLQIALAPGAELTEEEPRDGLRHVRMNAAGFKFSILVDPRTKLPARIERVVYHPVLGDVVLETRFADWRAVDGLRLPMRISQRLDGRWTLSDIHVATARVDAELGDLSAPPDVLESEPLEPAVTVESEEIAPGVWYLTGQSHHSVVIEMDDHLILVEAPQGDARTLAVIARARALRPAKPLRTVINTHHHFDHAGGLRAAIAEGLTVITHEKNRLFVDSLARRQHFIVADALAARPQAAHIESAGERQVLTHGTRTVEIHHISGSAHAETLLMVYLPTERLLIEADAYTPPPADVTPPPPTPFAANLLANIDRLGLRVERIVPLHGRVVSISALRAATAAGKP